MHSANIIKSAGSDKKRGNTIDTRLAKAPFIPKSLTTSIDVNPAEKPLNPISSKVAGKRNKNEEEMLIKRQYLKFVKTPFLNIAQIPFSEPTRDDM